MPTTTSTRDLTWPLCRENTDSTQIPAQSRPAQRLTRIASPLLEGAADALVRALEARHPSLFIHAQRVADVAASIADTLGLDAETIEDIRLAGRLQDVGMISVPSSILLKAGPLTKAEQRQVRDHVWASIGILARLPELGPVLHYVQHHHEQPDGRGYPWGLTSEEISLGGRVLAAADAYVALTSHRPYREPMDPSESLQVLAGVVGAKLDPLVFEALVQVVKARRLLPFVDDAA